MFANYPNASISCFVSVTWRYQAPVQAADLFGPLELGHVAAPARPAPFELPDLSGGGIQPPPEAAQIAWSRSPGPDLGAREEAARRASEFPGARLVQLWSKA